MAQKCAKNNCFMFYVLCFMFYVLCFLFDFIVSGFMFFCTFFGHVNLTGDRIILQGTC
jgi:hypothetical protein